MDDADAASLSSRGFRTILKNHRLNPSIMTTLLAADPQVHTHFILYSRSYCHLCDDMLEALQALSGEYPFTVEVIDVDADEGLVAQFDELVPVLYARKDNGESVPVCNYFLDENKVRAILS